MFEVLIKQNEPESTPRCETAACLSLGSHFWSPTLQCAPLPHRFYIKMESQPTERERESVYCSKAEVTRLQRDPRRVLHHVYVAASSPGFLLWGGTEGWAGVIFDSQLKWRCSGQEDECWEWVLCLKKIQTHEILWLWCVFFTKSHSYL